MKDNRQGWTRESEEGKGLRKRGRERRRGRVDKIIGERGKDGGWREGRGTEREG